MIESLESPNSGEPTTTNNGAAALKQVALGQPHRSFDDATGSKTEYDSTTEEKKRSTTTDDVEIDGNVAGNVCSAGGEGETATQEGGNIQVYLHGIRFALIATWYVSFLKPQIVFHIAHNSPLQPISAPQKRLRAGNSRGRLPESSQTATSCYAKGNCR